MGRKALHKICRLVSRKEVKYSQKKQVDGRKTPNGLKKKVCEGADLIYLAPTTGQPQAVVGEALYLWAFTKRDKIPENRSNCQLLQNCAS
jgi:hypothetical protein